MNYIMSEVFELLYNKKSENQKKTKIYLDIPFKLKDQLKIYNIKWCLKSKKWYIYNNNENEEKINSSINEYNEKNKKIYVRIPFELKDEVKVSGGVWSKKYNCWYFIKDNVNFKNYSDYIV